MSAKKKAAPEPQRVMDCPIRSCTDGPKHGRQRGAVSGIKKHVRLKHPEQFEKIADLFPPARGTDGLAERSINDLRKVAKVAGIEESGSKSKDEILAAIDAMPTGRKGAEAKSSR